MPNTRLTRFRRAQTIAPLQPTQRDREILWLVHQHRFLRSNHIVALVGGSRQQLLRRLQLLYHHGYLERPRAQLDYFQPGGSRHIVYGLGRKGWKLVGQDTVLLGESQHEIGRIFLAHSLLVSDFMVAIELACRDHPNVRFIPAHELVMAGKPRPFQWRVQLHNHFKVGVAPDQVFALEFTDKTGTRQRNYFFLEADRGTMPVKRRRLQQTSFYRKLLGYAATWNQNVHRSRFGISRFRVLTVTTIPKRVDTLLAACSELKHGQGLFLFADASILKQPHELLSRIWRTTNPDQRASLLD